jgi:hypothetical protein
MNAFEIAARNFVVSPKAGRRLERHREKQLKGWSRANKIGLIEKMNPGWEDLTPSFSNLGPSTQARRT